MSTLASRIEYYLQDLIKRKQGRLRIQRSKIAARFDCVPSQISYVLQTRFSPERGYIVESQRGGGGYIEIIKIEDEMPRELLSSIYRALDGGASQQQAFDLLHRLKEENLLTPREERMLKSIIHRETLKIPLPYRDMVRGRILRVVIENISRALEEG